MYKNQELKLRINGYTSQGLGVARAEGEVLFVHNALDGESGTARVLKTGRGFSYARMESFEEMSPERVEPDCPAYPACGGCAMRHMSYTEELKAKRMRVADALARIAACGLEPEGPIASPLTEGYRHKAQFRAGRDKSGCAVTGFYHARSNELVPVSDCRLQHETANRCAAALRDSGGDPGYSTVKTLLTRVSADGSDSHACVVGSDRRVLKSLTPRLIENCPTLSGVSFIHNERNDNVLLSGRAELVWGRAYLNESLCGFKLELSPTAFFQVNPRQAERLFKLAAEYAGNGKTALDLYCGAGVMTMMLAGQYERVYGAELDADAVQTAQRAAARNGVDNAAFEAGDAAAVAERWREQGIRPETVVIDPPRKGMDTEALSAVLSMDPERIVYVSCDPATLARDIKLMEPSYKPERCAAVDMFPRTAHVECVALLRRI